VGPVLGGGMTSRKELEGHYQASLFRADTPAGPLTLRIGSPSPELDALLDRHGATAWAYVTACNPGSRQLPAPENEKRTAKLRELIEQAGFAAYPGEGSDQGGTWREASFLVPGANESVADLLGRRFGQLA